MAGFSVQVKASVAKKIEKLSSPIKGRILKSLKGLEANPFPKGKQIKPFVGRDKTYRLRVGDYRIIIKVENQIITVLDLFHRKDLDRFRE
jgi:mRNA interferase RelE/StbE